MGNAGDTANISPKPQPADQTPPPAPKPAGEVKDVSNPIKDKVAGDTADIGQKR